MASPFEIRFSQEAGQDLAWFRKRDQKIVMDTTERQLKDQPDVETRHRKRLRPGHLTEWELRIGNHRVFYDVHDADRVVMIHAIGYKEGNRLLFQGVEYRDENDQH